MKVVVPDSLFTEDGHYFHHEYRDIGESSYRFLEDNGIIIRKGLFTLEEDRQIQRNWSKFVAKNNIDLSLIDYINLAKEHPKRGHRIMRKKLHFWPAICRKLPHRTAPQVANRILYIYSHSKRSDYVPRKYAPGRNWVIYRKIWDSIFESQSSIEEEHGRPFKKVLRTSITRWTVDDMTDVVAKVDIKCAAQASELSEEDAMKQWLKLVKLIRRNYDECVFGEISKSERVTLYDESISKALNKKPPMTLQQFRFFVNLVAKLFKQDHSRCANFGIHRMKDHMPELEEMIRDADMENIYSGGCSSVAEFLILKLRDVLKNAKRWFGSCNLQLAISEQLIIIKSALKQQMNASTKEGVSRKDAQKMNTKVIPSLGGFMRSPKVSYRFIVEALIKFGVRNYPEDFKLPNNYAFSVKSPDVLEIIAQVEANKSTTNMAKETYGDENKDPFLFVNGSPSASNNEEGNTYGDKKARNKNTLNSRTESSQQDVISNSTDYVRKSKRKIKDISSATAEIVDWEVSTS